MGVRESERHRDEFKRLSKQVRWRENSENEKESASKIRYENARSIHSLHTEMGYISIKLHKMATYTRSGPRGERERERARARANKNEKDLENTPSISISAIENRRIS